MVDSGREFGGVRGQKSWGKKGKNVGKRKWHKSVFTTHRERTTVKNVYVYKKERKKKDSSGWMGVYVEFLEGFSARLPGNVPYVLVQKCR
jgi:hypothetical protein